jgi:thymidylate synthase
MKYNSDYNDLVLKILAQGEKKKSRTGVDTISIFSYQLRHKMSDGFPLLTTKKMAYRSIITELLWFLRGDTNIKYLLDNNCNIWNGDAYKNYISTVNKSKDFKKWVEDYGIGYDKEYNPIYVTSHFSMDQFIEKIKNDKEFCERWGTLGNIYGHQWRFWGQGENGLGQLEKVIAKLKTNPDDRRLLVSAWNADQIDSMVLPPCHYSFQFYSSQLSLEKRIDLYKGIMGSDPVMRAASDMSEFLDSEKIPKRSLSLLFNMRSTDVGLGLPFNMASYGLLLEMVAKEVGMVSDELIFNGGDVHIYENHIEGLKKQIEGFEKYGNIPLPKLYLKSSIRSIFDYGVDNIDIVNYKSAPKIELPLSN